MYEQGLDLRCINNKQLKNILSNDFFTGIRTEIVENINLLQGRNSSDNHLNDQAQSVVLLNLFAHSISRALKKEKLENYCHLILYGSSEAFYNLAKSRHVIAATKSQDNEAAIFEEEEYKKHTGISPCIGVRICPEQSNELANVIICPEINSAADVRKKARDLVVRDWVNKAVTPAVSTQGHAALFGGALRRQEETGSQYNFDYKRG